MDFLSFYGWTIFSQSHLNSASCFNAGFVQTENFPSDFSNACQPFWRKDSVDQPFDFSSSTTSLNHTTRLTLTSFVSTDLSAKGTDSLLFLSPTTSTVSPCYPIFLNACWFKWRGVRVLTSPSLSLYSILCHNSLRIIWNFSYILYMNYLFKSFLDFNYVNNIYIGYFNECFEIYWILFVKFDM